jgi:threonine dehydratase
MVPSYHPALVQGVATYWWELLRAVPHMDVLYVPIGLGSGACAALAAKQALGHTVRVVGVVSTHATTYADSIAAGRVVEAPVSTTLADGMAVRRADAEPLAHLSAGLDHLVQVSDVQVAQAMRDLYTDTHNVAEGAGAASFAAAWAEREQLRGQVVGTTLCGGNVDASVFAGVLSHNHN